jgi:hypothetical protein
MEYIQKHVTEPVIPFAERVPEKEFPKGLEAVIVRAMSKRPEERYQSAAEFAEALRPFGGPAAQALVRVQPKKGAAAPGSSRSDAGDDFAPHARTRPSAGVLLSVAATCLALGVVLAVLVMRVLGR